MTEQLSSFEGIELTSSDETIITNIINTSGDPSTGGGLVAPVGSLALSTNGRGYYKNNIGNTDWVTVFTQTPNEFGTLVPQKLIPVLNDRLLLENSESGFQKNFITLQNFLDLVAEEASQGLDFSRRGNLTPGTVLLTRDGILSSSSGHPVGINNPELKAVYISTRDLDTYELTIFEHEGNNINRVNLAVVSATATRNLRAEAGIDFTILAPMTPGIQLGAELTTGTARDMMAEIVISGDL